MAEPVERSREPATGRGREAAGTGQTETGGGAKGRTGWGNVVQEAKGQARNIDPGMEAPQGAAVAGEGKAVTSFWSRGRERKTAARQEALIRVTEKP